MVNEDTTIRDLIAAAKNLKLWVDKINDACGRMSEEELKALERLLQETEKDGERSNRT